jgi:hypothetical protein
MDKRISMAAAAGVAALALAGSALADTHYYYFSFSNADPSDTYGDVSGSGSLVTTGDLPSALTDIIGSVDGGSVGASGPISGPSPYADADNTLYKGGKVSFGGISFDVGAMAYNIYSWNGGDWLLASTVDPVGYPQNGTPIDLDICLPEPSTWALLILGVAMTGSALRRRQAGQAVQA